MNHIRRIVAALATAVGALLTLIATSPAALAIRVPPPGGYDGTVQAPHLAPGHILHQPVHEIPSPIPVHTIVTGGMPGWQITLIAVAAAVVAAALAVILDRARAARRHLTAPAA
jgi:hypothetical protein